MLGRNVAEHVTATVFPVLPNPREVEMPNKVLLKNFDVVFKQTQAGIEKIGHLASWRTLSPAFGRETK